MLPTSQRSDEEAVNIKYVHAQDLQHLFSSKSQIFLHHVMFSIMSSSNHVASIINDVSKFSDVMQKLKYILDRRTLENIYVAFASHKLEYASILWYNCTEADKTKLENV